MADHPAVDWTKANWDRVPALQNLLRLSDLSRESVPTAKLAEPTTDDSETQPPALPALSDAGSAVAPKRGVRLQPMLFDATTDVADMVVPARSAAANLSSASLLACRPLLKLSDAALRGDPEMVDFVDAVSGAALDERLAVAVREADDEEMLEVEDFAIQQRRAQRLLELARADRSLPKAPVDPNKGFHESDAAAYPAIEPRFDFGDGRASRRPQSMHACGGETWFERHVAVAGPGESEVAVEVWCDELTTAEGRLLALETRLNALAHSGSSPPRSFVQAVIHGEDQL